MLADFPQGGYRPRHRESAKMASSRTGRTGKTRIHTALLSNQCYTANDDVPLGPAGPAEDGSRGPDRVVVDTFIVTGAADRQRQWARGGGYRGAPPGDRESEFPAEHAIANAVRMHELLHPRNIVALNDRGTVD